MNDITVVLGTDRGIVVYRGKGNGGWQQVGYGLAGQAITALAAWPDDEVILAGTRQGVFRSQGDEGNWTPAHAGLSLPHIRALAAHPRRPGLAYAGTEPAAVFRTTSAGAQWEELQTVRTLPGANRWYLPYSPAAGAVRSFALAGQRIWAAVEVGGVIRSDDGGDTWRIFTRGVHEDVHWVEIHPHDPEVLFAATGGGLYRTRDGGQTWDALGDDYTRAVWIDPDNPRTVLAGPALGIGRLGRIMRSDDSGDTWEPASEGLRLPMSGIVGRFVFSPAQPEELFALTSRGEVLRARRGAWVWERLWPEHTVNALLVLGGG